MKQNTNKRISLALFFFLMGRKLTTFPSRFHPLLSRAVHPTNAWPLKTVHCLAIGERTGFPLTAGSLWMIWWQQQWDQPNTNFQFFFSFFTITYFINVFYFAKETHCPLFKREMHFTVKCILLLVLLACASLQKKHFFSISIFNSIQCSQYCLTSF